MGLSNPATTRVFDGLMAQPAPSQESRTRRGLVGSLQAHWPEYMMEAAGLGIFMISACAFAVLLGHPSSPVVHLITSEVARRALTGIAMGLTAIAIIFSPFGKRSGAHINPAVTLTFFRLGRVEPWDAVFYTLFQFGGGLAGVLGSLLFLGNLIAHRAVAYVATVPGPLGARTAFVAECLISFIMMSVILLVSNTRGLGRWTGLFAGTLVALFITFESPFSGMSMNPARTFGSAAVAQIWTAVWIYFTAPPLGMLLAAELYTRLGRVNVCAKLHHYNNARCIFRCNFERVLSPTKGT